MVNNKKRKVWIGQAKAELETLFNSCEATAFDTHLFGKMAGYVICNLDVNFPDINNKPLQKLRASRLKCLGYVYEPRTQTWKAKN